MLPSTEPSLKIECDTGQGSEAESSLRHSKTACFGVKVIQNVWSPNDYSGSWNYQINESNPDDKPANMDSPPIVDSWNIYSTHPNHCESIYQMLEFQTQGSFHFVFCLVCAVNGQLVISGELLTYEAYSLFHHWLIRRCDRCVCIFVCFPMHPSWRGMIERNRLPACNVLGDVLLAQCKYSRVLPWKLTPGT